MVLIVLNGTCSCSRCFSASCRGAGGVELTVLRPSRQFSCLLFRAPDRSGGNLCPCEFLFDEIRCGIDLELFCEFDCNSQELCQWLKQQSGTKNSSLAGYFA